MKKEDKWVTCITSVLKVSTKGANITSWKLKKDMKQAEKTYKIENIENNYYKNHIKPRIRKINTKFF